MYVFINPKDAAPNEPKVTWNEAQKEIAAAKGFSVKDTSLTKGILKKNGFFSKRYCNFLPKKEQQIIQEQIIELLPIVTDVNAISEELNKHRLFEVILVPAIAFEDPHSKMANDQK